MEPTARDVEYLVTEKPPELLDFVEGCEIPGIRFSLHPPNIYCWIKAQYRCDRNAYRLTSMHFDPTIIRSLLMAGSHVPIGFDASGNAMLLVIDPPCPSNKVTWHYVSCDLETGTRVCLSQPLGECLCRGVRAIQGMAGSFPAMLFPLLPHGLSLR